MAGAMSYEEQRQRNVEANRRKMEELQLRYLSAAVQEPVPKPSPAKYLKRKRKLFVDRVYASDEAREYAINKAYQLQQKLGSHYPSFAKSMSQAQATGGLLSFPVSFVRKYLPKKHDEWVHLVDEEGAELRTHFLRNKKQLSGGWKKFAKDHDLVDGDCLVFQLIEDAKFKVYIIRQSSYYEN